ncbi:MAG: SH3 domain-containing protein [Oscillospiraceae bacterium]|nr:SH3 domain-containing protein [Oscillospiraceae bacterium]
MKKFTLFVSFIFTLSIIISIFIFAAPSVSAADSSSTAGKVTTTSTSLIVRSGMGTSYSRVAGLRSGSYVTLISKSGGWWKVEYASGQFGYCSADYITSVSSTAGYVSTSSSSLTVRTGAGTSYSVKNYIFRGTNILILSESSGWYKILYNGIQTGYVSALYIKKYESYSYVSLNTANYKQTDSRWADTELGSSGKTISQVGCAVSCLSITESYRTGTTITPNKLATSLSFTSGGAVYWPTNYVSYAESDYLKVVYSKLVEGKPVIIGGRTSLGSSHYVVITGFTGGTLSAGNFLIKDPGSTARTTLSQYSSKYTNFSKIVYYK